MELSRQMLLLTAVNYGSYYLHITKVTTFSNISQSRFWVMGYRFWVGLPFLLEKTSIRKALSTQNL